MFALRDLETRQHSSPSRKQRLTAPPRRALAPRARRPPRLFPLCPPPSRRRQTDYRAQLAGPADAGSSLPVVGVVDVEAIVSSWTGVGVM